jgi:hypothetical protein
VSRAYGVVPGPVAGEGQRRVNDAVVEVQSSTLPFEVHPLGYGYNGQAIGFLVPMIPQADCKDDDRLYQFQVVMAFPKLVGEARIVPRTVHVDDPERHSPSRLKLEPYHVGVRDVPLTVSLDEPITVTAKDQIRFVFDDIDLREEPFRFVVDGQAQVAFEPRPIHQWLFGEKALIVCP